MRRIPSTKLTAAEVAEKQARTPHREVPVRVAGVNRAFVLGDRVLFVSFLDGGGREYDYEEG